MVKHTKGEIASSTTLPCVLRMARNSSEMPHVGFANLRMDSKSIAHFSKLWNQPLIDPKQAGDLAELQEWLRAAWRDTTDPVAWEAIYQEGARTTRAKWDFRAQRIELTPEYLWNAACVLFLRDHAAHRTAICTNPQCSAPFFIKARRSQRFCGQGPCTEFAQRERANNWWGKHGNQWRAKRKKQAKMKGRKRS
jgi:hypothetical protein